MNGCHLQQIRTISKFNIFIIREFIGLSLNGAFTYGTIIL